MNKQAVNLIDAVNCSYYCIKCYQTKHYTDLKIGNLFTVTVTLM